MSGASAAPASGAATARFTIDRVAAFAGGDRRWVVEVFFQCAQGPIAGAPQALSVTDFMLRPEDPRSPVTLYVESLSYPTVSGGGVRLLVYADGGEARAAVATAAIAGPVVLRVSANALGTAVAEEYVFSLAADAVEARAGDRDAGPDVDYLAKDYESFRRSLLDSMAQRVPGWRERNPADLGVTIVEALAYAADYLSYAQDAVATEAYLGTARLRTSVRRHARLLDYVLDEGCNARVWVHLRVRHGVPGVVLPAGSQLLSAVGDPRVVIPMPTLDYARCLDQNPHVFETLHTVTLRAAHNEMHIDTGGRDDFVLAAGATAATLLVGAEPPALEAGDVLLLEARGSGARGHVVRLSESPVLTTGSPGETALGIRWFAEDALPFPLPVSRRTGAQVERRLAVARGNMALADYGRTRQRTLPPVPRGARATLPFGDEALTWRVPFDAARERGRPAAGALHQEPAAALPALSLHEAPGPARQPRAPAPDAGRTRWWPSRGLLEAGRFSRTFVVEVEEDGQATLRFGAGGLGRAPPAGTTFEAVYRTGNATTGNVGAGVLKHLATRLPELIRAVDGVRNPFPASGGARRGEVERARRFAPLAYQRQARCVTRADYETLARSLPGVHDAVARLRWTGSWATAFVYVQPAGDLRLGEPLRRSLIARFRPCLLAGTDLEIRAAVPAPLDIVLRVQCAVGRQTAAVHAALRSAFGTLRGAFFDPDRFAFGQSVSLLEVVARARRVHGVLDVQAERFRRRGAGPSGDAVEGEIAVGPLEIASVLNVPGRPGLGRIEFEVHGSRG